MNRLKRVVMFIVAPLLGLCLCAADQNPKLEKLSAEYDRRISQLATDFQRSIDKETHRFDSDADVALKIAMKEGDLKTANELADFKSKKTALGASAKLYDQVVLQCHYSLKYDGQGPLKGFSRAIALMPFGQLVDINTYKGYQPYWAIQSSSDGVVVLLVYFPDLQKPVALQCDVPKKGEFTNLMADTGDERRNFILLPDNAAK